MVTTAYDRRGQDVGNVIFLEHVNLRVPNQIAATNFYVAGLGFTRDPYMMVGTDNMWINLGRQQFHLPTGEAQRFRGTIGIVMSDLDALAGRLERIAPELTDTKFGFSPHREWVDVTCPWGNRFRIHCKLAGFSQPLGLAYLESPVPERTAAAITKFYDSCMGARAQFFSNDRGSDVVEVCVGPGQRLVFRDSAAAEVPYDGHHIAVYVADFSRPHAWLSERGLVSREDDEHQYRFESLIDPGGQRPIWRLEHEIRSLHHPLWRRPLVNRSW